jgi:flagellum-specific ATP synthase
LRIQAVGVAAAAADYFRRQGRRVLLVVDSLDELASAQREVGAVVGERAALAGHTPSALALVGQVLRCAGLGAVGSVAGVYVASVDDPGRADPIREAVRAGTDWQVWLWPESGVLSQSPPVAGGAVVAPAEASPTAPAERVEAAMEAGL